MDINSNSIFKNDLIITVKLSKKNENNLFDYDNIAKEKTLSIGSDGKIILKKDSFKFLSKEKHEEDSDTLYLCKDEISLLDITIARTNEMFVYSINKNQKLSPGINSSLDKNLIWRVVGKENIINKTLGVISSSVDNQVCLKKNDVIKFGKLKLFVSNIMKFSDTKLALINKGEEKKEEEEEKRILFKVNHRSIKEFPSEHKDKNQCRVCYSKDSDEENPLISICNCIGSVQYIHYSCLQTWIVTRSTFKEKENLLIIKSRFYCEICKAPLPTTFTLKNKVYPLVENLLDLDQEKKDYLILESIDCKTSDYYQYIYIISLEDGKECTLGRDKNSDIKLKDAYSSLIHAGIIYKNNNFLISDKNSKYGTLILKNKQILKVGSKIKNFQIGNVFFSLFKKINSQWFYSPKLTEKNYYSNLSSESNMLNSTYLSDQYESIISKIQYSSKNSNLEDISII